MYILERNNALAKRDFSVHKVWERIYTGGYPEVVSGNVDPKDFYASYLKTYIERDIRSLTQVADELQFLQFITIAASRTSQLLNYSDMAQECGISEMTAKKWMSLLTTSGIVYLLKPFSTKVEKRVVKTPKLYFMDTGLAAYLTRWPDADTLENGNAAGAFFETYVITEILKSRMNAGIDPGMYYYRDIDQREIDLIIEEGRCLYPIEIKKARNPSVKERNLKVLNKSDRDIKPAIVLCMTSEFVPLSKAIWLCPISVI